MEKRPLFHEKHPVYYMVWGCFSPENIGVVKLFSAYSPSRFAATRQQGTRYQRHGHTSDNKDGFCPWLCRGCQMFALSSKKRRDHRENDPGGGVILSVQVKHII
jgi:hypothetical protein